MKKWLRILLPVIVLLSLLLTLPVQAADLTVTSFSVTDMGATGVSLNWTMPPLATYTMIRVSRIAYPTSVTDGELFYYGVSSSVNSTGYALDITKYFFVAVGYDSDNVTHATTFATAFIGGDKVENIATQLSVFNGLLTTIVSFLLVVVITLFAFWHRDRILYILSGMMFMLYGWDYWSTSQAFSIALVIAGLVIWIKAGMQKRAE